jgi:hypothetical protein
VDREAFPEECPLPDYFLKENPRVKKGYVVCRCPRPAALNESITALPWQSLREEKVSRITESF